VSFVYCLDEYFKKFHRVSTYSYKESMQVSLISNLENLLIKELDGLR